MKAIFIIILFYSFTYAQLCDDIQKLSKTTSDTNIVKNRNDLIGNWKKNENKSETYEDQFDVGLVNSPTIEVGLNSIKYIKTYLHKDSSYYKATITGMWFIEDNVFKISGKLLKETKFGKDTLKREEESIEYCTVYTFSNNILCFEGLVMSKLYENPQIEIECFEKAGN